jgi:hypothetical protein
MQDRDARVIICAPSEYDAGAIRDPLAGQTEEIEQSIRAFYNPVPVIGRVTADQLSEILRRGADGFWFIGHAMSGPTGGIALSDGIWPTRELGRYLARAGVQWSYLNTCDSGGLVVELQDIWAHDVFANITSEIGDKEASQNGVHLAQGIADTGRMLKAYRWVVSGGPSKLRIFPSPSGAGIIAERDEIITREPRSAAYVPADAKIQETLIRLEVGLERTREDVKELKEDDELEVFKRVVFERLDKQAEWISELRSDVRPLAQAGMLLQAQRASPEQGNLMRNLLIVVVLVGLGIFAVMIILLVYATVGGGGGG